MRKLSNLQPGGLGLVTIASILLGTIGIATQAIYEVDGTTSLFINLARLVVAAPVLLAACWRVLGQKMFKVRRRDLAIMVLGGTLLATSHSMYFASIRYAGVTISTLLAICIAPLVVTGIAVLLKWEKLTRRIVIALVCALVGAVLLVSLGASEEAHPDLLLGSVIAAASAITYAGSILCSRFVAANYHPLQATAISFSAGTVVLLVVNLVVGFVPITTTQGWLLVLYLGLICTALAYWLFQIGLRTVSATAASIVTMLDPLVTAVLAWILFGEILAPSGLLGAALLMLSIYLLSVDSSKRAESG